MLFWCLYSTSASMCFAWFTWSFKSSSLIPLFLASVGLVPGWSLSRHSGSRCPSGGRGMVWREEWRPSLDIPEARIHPREEPRPQSGQEEHPRQQDEQEHGEHHSCPQDCHLHAIYCEFSNTSLFIYTFPNQLYSPITKFYTISLVCMIFPNNCKLAVISFRSVRFFG